MMDALQKIVKWPAGPSDATLWVLIALVLFVLLLVRQKVPHKAGQALDDRASKIAEELETAKQLREEAQEFLAAAQRRHSEAENEAADIVTQARREADRLAADMRAQMKDQLERRAAMAEAKIAQAEADAAALVRGQAADAAIAAATALLTEKLDDAAQDSLIEDSIADFGRNFR